VDIKKYVAGGVVVMDLKAGSIVWSEHLDLTTDQTALRAYIYSSPTVVDLDGNLLNRSSFSYISIHIHDSWRCHEQQ
jgi:hypothetical protein